MLNVERPSLASTSRLIDGRRAEKHFSSYHFARSRTAVFQDVTLRLLTGGMNSDCFISLRPYLLVIYQNHYFAYLSFHLVGVSHCSMAQAGFRPSVHGAWVREAAVIDSGAELRRVGGLA